MGQSYRFSPITDKITFENALSYIATCATELVKQVLGRELPVDTLTVFSHFPEEYKYLETLIKSYGRLSELSHGITVYVETDRLVNGQQIKLLGLRQPEQSRSEVGYADYPVDNYDRILNLKSPYINQIISGRGRRLLEVRHEAFDIRGYIVDKQGHLSV